MTLFGFDTSGCKALRVVGYTLAGKRRTDILAAVVEAEYADGTVVEIAVDLEMNLGAFLALIKAVNRGLAELNE